MVVRGTIQFHSQFFSGAVEIQNVDTDTVLASELSPLDLSALEDPGSLPSARMLREMSECYDNSYARFALAKSLEHRSALQSEPLPAELEARFTRLAEESIAKQGEIEAADKIPFETFRQRYLSHESLRI